MLLGFQQKLIIFNKILYVFSPRNIYNTAVLKENLQVYKCYSKLLQ